MTETKIMLPKPTAADLAAAAAEVSLGEGDFRVVGFQPPHFGKSNKEGMDHVFQAAVKLAPLKNPRDKTSQRQDLAVSIWLVYPVSMDPNPDAEKRKKVPVRDLSDTCRFFRALYGDAFPRWPIFKQKGQSKKDFEAERGKCVAAAAEAFAKVHDNPASVKNWAVDLRRRKKGEYMNQAFYEESFLKELDPPWAYTEPRGV
jgi:hypothetical protein